MDIDEVKKLFCEINYLINKNIINDDIYKHINIKKIDMFNLDIGEENNVSFWGILEKKENNYLISKYKNFFESDNPILYKFHNNKKFCGFSITDGNKKTINQKEQYIKNIFEYKNITNKIYNFLDFFIKNNLIKNIGITEDKIKLYLIINNLNFKLFLLNSKKYFDIDINYFLSIFEYNVFTPLICGLNIYNDSYDFKIYYEYKKNIFGQKYFFDNQAENILDELYNKYINGNFFYKKLINKINETSPFFHGLGLQNNKKIFKLYYHWDKNR